MDFPIEYKADYRAVDLPKNTVQIQNALLHASAEQDTFRGILPSARKDFAKTCVSIHSIYSC